MENAKPFKKEDVTEKLVDALLAEWGEIPAVVVGDVCSVCRLPIIVKKDHHPKDKTP